MSINYKLEIIFLTNHNSICRSNLQRWQELADEHQSSQNSTNTSASNEITDSTNTHQPTSS